MDYEDEEDAEEYSHMDDSAEDSTYEFSAEETSTSVVIRNRLVLITDVL
jgi:hypothetical protein